MQCPKCKHPETAVVDSRDTNENREIRRRRECEKCHHRFTTFERLETRSFIVQKKDGAREPYSREKLERGVWIACGKRKITQEQIAKLIDHVEEELAGEGPEISSKRIGEAVMEGLRTLDDVAYIRFASVYRQFKDLESFKKELTKLLEK